jgi:hypothetical protein
MKAPFVINPAYAAIAVAYSNSRLIADDVLPRTPVATQEFKYLVHTLADSFTLPETRVGRKSQPNQVEFSSTERTDATFDHGLDDTIPQADIDNAAGSRLPDPKAKAVRNLTDLILLAREVRVANLVFAQGSYGVNNRITLSGTSQWSDFVNSNPVDAIAGYLDACVMRPNIGVFGRATWTKLAQHPRVCLAVFGNNTNAGIVSRRAFADLFELDDIYVGEGWVNTARKGQAVNMQRVWGKHASFLHRNLQADNTQGATFGITAQWGPRIAGDMVDMDVGLRGGSRLRVGESVKELVTANDLGYLVTNAVA